MQYMYLLHIQVRSHNILWPTIQEVPLNEVISTSEARGQVEKWLLQLEGIMVSSLHMVSANVNHNLAQVM